MQMHKGTGRTRATELGAAWINVQVLRMPRVSGTWNTPTSRCRTFALPFPLGPVSAAVTDSHISLWKERASRLRPPPRPPDLPTSALDSCHLVCTSGFLTASTQQVLILSPTTSFRALALTQHGQGNVQRRAKGGLWSRCSSLPRSRGHRRDEGDPDG